MPRLLCPLQPDVYPGQCWAFKGSTGYIVLQLAVTIRPTSFSLEHIPKLLSTTGSIDSAPKDFTVLVGVFLPSQSITYTFLLVCHNTMLERLTTDVYSFEELFCVILWWKCNRNTDHTTGGTVMCVARQTVTGQHSSVTCSGGIAVDHSARDDGGSSSALSYGSTQPASGCSLYLCAFSFVSIVVLCERGCLRCSCHCVSQS